MDVTSVYKILLCDEIFKDWQINPIKLTNSPPKVAGPGSSGGKRVKFKPDTTGYVSLVLANYNCSQSCPRR